MTEFLFQVCVSVSKRALSLSLASVCLLAAAAAASTAGGVRCNQESHVRSSIRQYNGHWGCHRRQAEATARVALESRSQTATPREDPSERCLPPAYIDLSSGYVKKRRRPGSSTGKVMLPRSHANAGGRLPRWNLRSFTSRQDYPGLFRTYAPRTPM